MGQLNEIECKSLYSFMGTFEPRYSAVSVPCLRKSLPKFRQHGRNFYTFAKRDRCLLQIVSGQCTAAIHFPQWLFRLPRQVVQLLIVVDQVHVKCDAGLMHGFLRRLSGLEEIGLAAVVDFQAFELPGDFYFLMRPDGPGCSGLVIADDGDVIAAGIVDHAVPVDRAALDQRCDCGKAECWDEVAADRCHGVLPVE